jgi:RNA polymerase sigma-70 factor (ECF subfamily)
LTIVDSPSSPTLERIVDRLRVRLVEFAASKGMGDRADDVVQETLEVLWRKYQAVEAEIDLIRLAFTICKYKMLEGKRPRQHAGEEGLDDEFPVADSRPNVEASLIDRSERQRLREAIERLGERCRQIFRLRLQSRSTAQIASVMAASAATVHVWEHRCRKALFQELA